MRAKYCKCKNTYTIKGCGKRGCNQPYYWSQGIGRIYEEPVKNETFDITFDETFK
jgi:hypothetical protein